MPTGTMKLKRTEWLAIAITAAFLMLVAGIHIGSRSRSVPVTVQTIPSASETAVPSENAMRDGTPEQCAEPVNLNTATKEELETLSGVGPMLAERIIAYREAYGPFERIEDITRVQGIAEKIFSENFGRLTVD